MKPYVFPPHKYSIFPLFSDIPHKEWIFDSAPCKHDLCGYRMNAKNSIGVYTQLYECYEDKRYLAKLRLFYYYTQNVNRRAKVSTKVQKLVKVYQY